jgi:hypothetical protein
MQTLVGEIKAVQEELENENGCHAEHSAHQAETQHDGLTISCTTLK